MIKLMVNLPQIGDVLQYTNWQRSEPNSGQTSNVAYLWANGGEWYDLGSGYSRHTLCVNFSKYLNKM